MLSMGVPPLHIPAGSWGIPDWIRAVLPWPLDAQEIQFPAVRPAGVSVSASCAKGRAFRLMCGFVWLGVFRMGALGLWWLWVVVIFCTGMKVFLFPRGGRAQAHICAQSTSFCISPCTCGLGLREQEGDVSLDLEVPGRVRMEQ